MYPQRTASAFLSRLTPTIAGPLLVLLLASPAAAVGTIQGKTFDKDLGVGVGTLVFAPTGQQNTVAPNYTFSFSNVQSGVSVFTSSNPPYGYLKAEVSVCT